MAAIAYAGELQEEGRRQFWDEQRLAAVPKVSPDGPSLLQLVKRATRKQAYDAERARPAPSPGIVRVKPGFRHEQKPQHGFAALANRVRHNGSPAAQQPLPRQPTLAETMASIKAQPRQLSLAENTDARKAPETKVSGHDTRWAEARIPAAERSPIWHAERREQNLRLGVQQAEARADHAHEASTVAKMAADSWRTQHPTRARLHDMGFKSKEYTALREEHRQAHHEAKNARVGVANANVELEHQRKQMEGYYKLNGKQPPWAERAAGMARKAAEKQKEAPAAHKPPVMPQPSIGESLRRQPIPAPAAPKLSPDDRKLSL